MWLGGTCEPGGRGLKTQSVSLTLNIHNELLRAWCFFFHLTFTNPTELTLLFVTILQIRKLKLMESQSWEVARAIQIQFVPQINTGNLGGWLVGHWDWSLHSCKLGMIFYFIFVSKPQFAFRVLKGKNIPPFFCARCENCSQRRVNWKSTDVFIINRLGAPGGGGTRL